MRKMSVTKKLWLAALLVLVLSALLCVAVGAETRTGTCGADGDNLTWSLDTESGELVLSGTGAMDDYSSTSAPWYSYCSSIKTITIGDDVTSIGKYAFYDCSSLTSVSIPEGVTSIGWAAFYKCSSLTSVSIPDSVTSIGGTAFRDCSSLTSVTIGEGVTSIGDYAFFRCTSLTSVSIPGSVTSIGSSAFSDCSSLTSVNIPGSVTSIGDNAFYYCPKLVEVYNLSSLNITKGSSGNGYVGYYALNVYTPTSGESKLSTTEDGYIFYEDGETVYLVGYVGSETALILPDTYNGKSYSVYKYAFEGCSSLTSVSIGEGVTSIGNYAFPGCSSLTSVSIPEGVTSIGDNAFSACSSLTSVSIPGSVTSIGAWAFADCSGISSLSVDEDNSVYYSEGNCIIEKASKTLVVGCKNSVIPEGVTSIGEWAFSGCSFLTSVSIGEGVTSIGDYAFRACASLTSVTIGEGVTSIGVAAFRGCTSLTSVSIPDSVTSIGNYAFRDCSSLTSVTVLSKTVTIYDSQYTFPTGATIYGYEGSTAQGYATEYGRTFVALKEFLYSGTCGADGDNLTWGLTSDGELVLSGTGAMASYPKEKYTTAPWYPYRDSIKTLIIEDGVTYVGACAFLRYEALERVMLADSVKTIDGSAFGNCTSLTSITLPEGLISMGYGTFLGCSALENITIPESLTGIAGQVFYGCDSLNTNVYGGAKYIGTATNPYLILVAAESADTTECHVHPNTKMIDGGALSACTSLTTVTVDEGNTVFYSEGNCIINKATGALVSGCKTSVIPTDGSITEIYRYAFMDCSALESITIPDSVTSIGTYAFRGCTKLSTVTIPRSVTSIASTDGTTFPITTTVYGYEGSAAETYATEYGRNFVSLDTGGMSGTCGEKLTWALTEDGVLTISGTGAMTHCKELSVPWYSHRDSIKTVIIESGVTSIGSYAFYGCTALENVTIPESVTSIGSYTFRYCSNLASVTIPEGVTWIGAVAFEYCSALTSVNIPEGVTTIGASTFAYCSALTELTIPESVTAIGQYAFKNCFGFTEVTIPKNLTSIGNGAFAACKNIASLTVDADNSVYYSENNCIIDRASKTLVLGCKTSVIPEDVTAIGTRAFRGCEDLVSVTIPEGVRSIDEFAFNECTALASVTVPSSVTSIGNSAFKDCTVLKSVTIPSKTVEIYDSEYTISDTATIYGYTGSTAEAYAIKYGRTFVKLEEKLDAAVISYQVEVSVDGKFSLRLISGLNSLNYTCFGYEVTVTTKDEGGNDVIKTLSGTDNKAYSSIYGGNTAYSIKENFGYEYASLATLTGLAADSEYTKLEISTYVVLDGERVYGNGATLLYTGETDASGYPALSFEAE